MRHKYKTHGLVLSRTHSGEATTFIKLLTPDLGLVQARVQSLRKPGAKLAATLATFMESDVQLVHGKEGWRIVGGVLKENWFLRLGTFDVRTRISHIVGLLLRFVVGEVQDLQLFPIVYGLLGSLADLPESFHEAIEILAVLRILQVLGFDAGEIPGELETYSIPILEAVFSNRSSYVARINKGIAESGL